ncbi:MAG: DivIVA domain-containing protein [Bacillota bacterium]
MKFSPLDIYNKEFKKSAFGYNSGEVDEFLDEVGLAYERLLKDYSSLEDEKERLEEKLENYREIQEKLEDTLDSVQNTVREQTNQAKKEADNIINKAELEAEKIKQRARNEIQNERHRLENLKEQKELFRIRFKSLLENYLQLIDNDSTNKIGLSREELHDLIEDDNDNKLKDQINEDKIENVESEQTETTSQMDFEEKPARNIDLDDTRVNE